MIDKNLICISDRIMERLWPKNPASGFIRRIQQYKKSQAIHNPTMKEFVRGKKK